MYSVSENMPGGIYLIHEKGQLIEMTEQPYDSEDLLQQLLEKYPSILAGDQIDNTSPRRWLLISRELNLASEKDGAGRWSVDHLFLDQDGIPTIIEVKRSSDTRIRREIVGQMLDYAANAVVYWPIEVLRSEFEEYWKKQNFEPEQVLMNFLGSERSIEDFWQDVKTNLQAGKVRLVFVADKIPPELRRIVEFLNEQMDPAEVLAVELRQFVGNGVKTLVPRVFGQTEEAIQKKTGARMETKQWDEATFFKELEIKRGSDEIAIARKILNWGIQKQLKFWWGKGAKSGSFFPMFDYKDITHLIISVWTYGTIEIQFQWMQNKPPFNDKIKRQELLARLNNIPGIQLPPEAITKRPSIPLSTLIDEKKYNQFIIILDWIIQEIRTSYQDNINKTDLRSVN